MNWDRIGGTEKSDPECYSESGSTIAESGSTIAGQARIGDLWCRLMHTEPMWPSHGRYECRTCGRRFQVSWEEPSVTPPALGWTPETQAQISLAAGRL
jgi:hypothetical protein